MQRAFFYIGMVGGATTFFLTLVVVGSVLVLAGTVSEDIEYRSLLVHGCLETFGLQLEHGLIPTTLGH